MCSEWAETSPAWGDRRPQPSPGTRRLSLQRSADEPYLFSEEDQSTRINNRHTECWHYYSSCSRARGIVRAPARPRTPRPAGGGARSGHGTGTDGSDPPRGPARAGRGAGPHTSDRGGRGPGGAGDRLRSSAGVRRSRTPHRSACTDPARLIRRVARRPSAPRPVVASLI